jgi:hypothetical protein
MSENNQTYIPCECWTPYHFLLIQPDPDMGEGKLNVSFVSTRNGSVWHRLKWALKHIVGRDDLTFADIIVDRERLAAAIRSRVEDGRG